MLVAFDSSKMLAWLMNVIFTKVLELWVLRVANHIAAQLQSDERGINSAVPARLGRTRSFTPVLQAVNTKTIPYTAGMKYFARQKSLSMTIDA